MRKETPVSLPLYRFLWLKLLGAMRFKMPGPQQSGQGWKRALRAREETKFSPHFSVIPMLMPDRQAV